jgi:hypothetical protein
MVGMGEKAAGGQSSHCCAHFQAHDNGGGQPQGASRGNREGAPESGAKLWRGFLLDLPARNVIMDRVCGVGRFV